MTAGIPLLWSQLLQMQAMETMTKQTRLWTSNLLNTISFSLLFNIFLIIVYLSIINKYLFHAHHAIGHMNAFQGCSGNAFQGCSGTCST